MKHSQLLDSSIGSLHVRLDGLMFQYGHGINFIIPRFHLDEAIIASAKVAFLTKFLKTDLKSNAPRYSSPTQVKELEIAGTEYPKLHRLKRTNPEAYFYWHHAIGLR